MTSSRRSNFHRGQSKVWFSSYPERDEYGFVALAPTPVFNPPKAVKSRLSPPEVTTTSWSYRRGSPGSFKSHDSGFSDSDNPSPPTTNHNNSLLDHSSASSEGTHTPKRSQLSRCSSASSSGPATPPTVIRKKIDMTLATGLCRRISFSAPSSPIYERIETPSLISQIDSLNYATTSPATSKGDFSLDSSLEEDYTSPKKGSRVLKRGKVIRRSSNRTEAKLLRCVSQISIGSANDFYQAVASTTDDEQRVPTISSMMSYDNTDDEPAPQMMQTAIPQTPTSSDRTYHNDTIVFGTGHTDNLERSHHHILPTYDELFPNQTSTPKAASKSQHHQQNITDSVLELPATINWDDFTYYEYSNPLLNGHAPSIQHWLDDTRKQYCHEVLATLQTKSIGQSAARHGNLTTTAAGKLIRSLQSRCGQLQYEFEYLEKLLEDTDDDDALIKEVPERVLRLHARTQEFGAKMSTAQVFDVQYQNNVAYINNLSYDLVRTTSTRDLSRLQPLGVLEDVLLLKRYVLITLRMVFEQLVRSIVDRIADVKFDFILRSNLSLLALLSNTEFNGFASLSDAFLESRAIRVLLNVCAESMVPAVRTLGLRALTTICANAEAISEFGACGGTEIIAGILCDKHSGGGARSEQEVREALSVFAQVTADWHGPDHYLVGLKPLVETLVTRLTELAARTTCCQTLLLSVAALKNLARMESSAIYSLMSNESVLRLKRACDARGHDASVFLIEQLVSILVHMSNNRRCQHHLTNKSILSYMTQLYQWLSSAAQPATEAERASRDRSVKNILHIFSRLLQYTAAHKDVMEQSVGALFARLHERVSQDEAALNASARIVFRELSIAFGQIGLNDSASAGTSSLEQSTQSIGGVPARNKHVDDDALRPEAPKKLLESYV